MKHKSSETACPASAWAGRAMRMAAMLGLGVAVLSSVRVFAAEKAVVAAPAKPAMTQALEALGIEFIGLQLTAENNLIGLRYRVKDALKSKALVERNVQPVLVNEATGERYYVPRAPVRPGPRRQTAADQPVQVGKVYSMMFANPDRKLRVGEKVTLYAGDSVLKGVQVQ